jgi:uncharacterized protein (DUF2126 family)
VKLDRQQHIRLGRCLYDTTESELTGLFEHFHAFNQNLASGNTARVVDASAVVPNMATFGKSLEAAVMQRPTTL